MIKGKWQHSDPLLKMLLFCGIVMICFGLISVLNIPLIQIFFGKSLPEVMSGFSSGDTTYINAMKFIQIFSQLGLMLVPAWLCGWLFSDNVVQFFQFKKINFIQISVIVVVTICLSPLINLLLDWNSHLQLPASLAAMEEMMRSMETEAEKLTESFLVMHTNFDLIINLLMIALLPAVGEELLFRGVLQKLIQQATKNKHWAVLITGFIFSAIHMQFFGFLPRFMLGIFLGYLLVWTGSIWAPILAHFINNGSAVLLSYYEQKNAITIDEEKLGIREGEYWMVFASIIITVSACYILYRSKQKTS